MELPDEGRAGGVQDTERAGGRIKQKSEVPNKRQVRAAEARLRQAEQDT